MNSNDNDGSEKIPLRSRDKVKQVTMGIADNMIKASALFNYVVHIVNRLHVQKLDCDTVQELRIKYRHTSGNPAFRVL